MREVWDETGYETRIRREIHQRETITYGVNVHIKYYHVELLGGEITFQDPDEEIEEISWKPISALENIDFLFENEREILHHYITFSLIDET